MKRPPVFIVGFAKSGTTLLQSLLDGHPELFVVPIEVKFFCHAGLPGLHPGHQPQPPHQPEQIAVPIERVEPSEVREGLLRHADFARLLAGGRVERNVDLSGSGFDRERFLEAARSAPCTSLRELFSGILNAFHAGFADERDPDRLRFVEKTPTQEDYAEELARWYPGATFLHVVRNPYANVVAIHKWARRAEDLRNAVYRGFAKSYYFLERNLRYLEHYHVVRYEDIVEATRPTLEGIAETLGIEWSESLLEPTFRGRPWGGNSLTVGGEFRGIDRRPLEAWRLRISALDVALVNKFFSNFLRKHGYEVLPEPGWRAWLPLRFETPIRYWLNRALLRDRVL